MTSAAKFPTIMMRKVVGEMAVRPEVIPFILASLAVGVGLTCVLRLFGMPWGKTVGAGGAVALILAGYMLYFFRDPERHPPADPAALVAGADGTVMSVVERNEPTFLKTNAVRISIFLSLFDVHVNRAPIEGHIKFLKYYPGKRFFTFEEKSSEFNQHSSIFIQGPRTSCLVNQIVGPVARRVVYWLELEQEVKTGDRIGMMKFGSRLDMYFPRDDVQVEVKKGDKVRAGETVVARLKDKATS